MTTQTFTVTITSDDDFTRDDVAAELHDLLVDRAQGFIGDPEQSPLPPQLVVEVQ